MSNPYPHLTPLEDWDELRRQQDAQLARWELRRKVKRLIADVLFIAGGIALVWYLVYMMWR